jgi:hypothetical protein
MSTATLNIWITEFSDPCHIMSRKEYYVHIVDCEGKPLVWCGRDYTFMPVKCGHLEVEVPPGCYAVFGTESPKGAGIVPFGNHLTHIQVVRANCGDHVCVTLFVPEFGHCGTWFHQALVGHAPIFQRADIDRVLVTSATEAVQAVVRAVQEVSPPTAFDRNLFANFGHDSPRPK